MSDVTITGCKVCVINARGKNSEYCNRGYSQATCADVGEAYTRGEQNERKRIIALARQWAIDYDTGAEGAGMPDFDLYLLMAKAMRQFANELEAECE